MKIRVDKCVLVTFANGEKKIYTPSYRMDEFDNVKGWNDILETENESDFYHFANGWIDSVTDDYGDLVKVEFITRFTEQELNEIIKPYKEYFFVEVWNPHYGEHEIYMDEELDENLACGGAENQSVYPNGHERNQCLPMTKAELIEELESWKEQVLKWRVEASKGN